MPTTADIQAAIEASPIIKLKDVAVDISHSGKSTGVGIFHPAHDDASVTVICNPADFDPNVVTVGTAEQLEQLTTAYREVASTIGFSLGPVDTVGPRHEAEHAAAALALGADRVEYGIKFAHVVIGIDADVATLALHVQLFMSPTITTTKLGFAAILAAPSVPSKSDTAALQAMGYTGVEDVAKRVTQHNQRSNQKIPMPLSFALNARAGQTTLPYRSAASLNCPLGVPETGLG